MTKTVHIGGASGYWGESAMATPQLLSHPKLDYLVYDYLAEITMSIMARAKAKDPAKGYATDFVDFVMKPFLPMIASRGVKVIANAGGVNPEACGAAVRALIKEKGLNLKVAVITGDDRMFNLETIAREKPGSMFSAGSFPPVDKVASINAYLGAFPIAKALELGADIIITGRCVDSAVTLGACIHEFGWEVDNWDMLASGSLAGHILECGPQATGGNFTDWQDSKDIGNIGYPICEISDDGSFVTTKPKRTGGIVNVGTVSEQMLYEIGDPTAYMLPDVMCNFSDVRIEQIGKDRVQVSPAKGYVAPPTYKTCLTYQDGFRAGTYMTIYGENATAKAVKLADAAFDRATKTLRMFNLGPFTQTSIEILGAGSQKGQYRTTDEVVLKIAAMHLDVKGVGILLKELAGLGLATPPGLSGFTGVRSKPSPVMKLYSYLTTKPSVEIAIDIDGTKTTLKDKFFAAKYAYWQRKLNSAYNDKYFHIDSPNFRKTEPIADATVEVPLIKLAWGRSGDKGDSANIGIIARKPEYLPYIRASLTDELVRETFHHFSPGRIVVFDLPGSNALNILIGQVLGGGGAASLRNDAQGKGYAQILLAKPIKVSKSIAESL